jgi:two-component system sensor histidine kinase CpxA
MRILAPLARLTRRLAFKIFVAFWIAMALVGGVLLAVETTRTEKLAQRWRGVTGDAFAVYATAVAGDYENPESRMAKEFLANMEQRTRIQAWLFDTQGEEVSGYAQADRQAHPPWLRERVQQLVERARSSAQTEFDELGWVTLAARSARAPSGQTFVLVGVLPATRYNFWGASPRVQLLRLLAIFMTAGLVSWVLARHLTQPLEAVRAAAQQLARGDLSARASPALDRRRDELAELASDFNGMAERIEHLLREQERLVAAQRRLLADVAHELRSPLARASVALELARDALNDDGLSSDTYLNSAPLSEGEGSDEDATALPLPPHQLQPVNESLDRIESETGRLTELIDRLLVLSRLESGVQKPDQTFVDLSSLVRAVAADADFEARRNGRQVRVLACEPCIMSGTSDLLRSAVENVVRNAVRHTPSDTAVEVSIERNSGDARQLWESESISGCYTSPLPPEHIALAHSHTVAWAVVKVRDLGKGVPPEELGEVFQPFYRARGARDRQSGGVGLGLSITARAVELHGGQFRVCNCPDDGGLIVELRLPLIDNV